MASSSGSGEIDFQGSTYQTLDGPGNKLLINAGNIGQINMDRCSKTTGDDDRHRGKQPGNRNEPGGNICGRNNNQNTNDNHCYHKNGSLSRWWSDATRALKIKLRHAYRNATLPKQSWLEEVNYLKLQDYYAKLKLDSTVKPIEIETIFEKNTKSTEGKLPMRIVVEGQPGFGKTTLASKLAFDWAVGENYMKRFKLVFVLHLKDILNETITTGIEKEVHKCGFYDDERLQDAICSNGSKVLIILDGLDELPSGTTRDCVYKVLYEQNYSDATVVVTCRTGMIDVKHEELGNFNPVVATRKKFWDKKVSVTGLDQLGIRKLLSKILTPCQATALIDKLPDKNEPFGEIFQCPLIVMLLGVLYGKRIVVELKTTMTKLYREILNGLATYNISKQKATVNEEFNSTNSSDEDLLTQFGEVCFQLVVESKDEFENNELMEKVYKKGFLSKVEKKAQVLTTIHFESIHRSFTEFFAAFYMKEKMKMAEDKKLNEDIVRSLHKIYFDTRGTSLVLPFLVGMLESDAHILFHQLYPNFQLYSRFQFGLWRMMEECQQTGKNVQTLVSFIPQIINETGATKLFSSASSDIFKHLMKDGIQQFRTKQLQVLTYRDEIFNCPQNVHFERIVFFFETNSLKKNGYKKYSTFFSKVSCSSVAFSFRGQFENSKNNQKEMSEWLNLLENLQTERRILAIEKSTTCGLLLSCLNNNTLNQMPIHFTHCVVENDGCDWLKLLLLLMTKNQLQGLFLSVEDAVCWPKVRELLNFAPKSQFLSSLMLYVSPNAQSAEEVVDLKNLIKYETNEWDELIFSGVNVTSTIPASKTFKINSLTCGGSDESTANSLLNSSISSFTCISSFFLKLQNANDFYDSKIFSLTELIIEQDDYQLHNRDQFLEPKLWKNLENFSQIEHFGIVFNNNTPISENMISSLKSMKFTCLEIWYKESSFDVTRCFIQLLAKSFPWKLNNKKHPITQIYVCICGEICNLSQLVLPLLDCVKNQIIEEVAIILNTGNETWKFESFSWVDIDTFRMEHTIAGIRKDDFKLWRSRYNNGSLHQKMTIHLR